MKPLIRTLNMIWWYLHGSNTYKQILFCPYLLMAAVRIPHPNRLRELWLTLLKNLYVRDVFKCVISKRLEGVVLNNHFVVLFPFTRLWPFLFIGFLDRFSPCSCKKEKRKRKSSYIKTSDSYKCLFSTIAPSWPDLG